jgi:asparagine synthase (glutamine-hydrolysing)
MCGFAALFDPGRRFEPEILAGIDADLIHRGPDSGGVRSWSGAALVFRRLAIIDTRAASDQPMTSADGRQTLVFNGEIYNFRELRRELQAAGVGLRTAGDTEVILEGYRLWGPSVVDRLEGMYAFVIVDYARSVAFAARDPLGIKPLYLLRKGTLVGLASEMRAFARLVAPEPDPASMAELLTFGWAAGKLSNLRHIERVPGGTYIEIPLHGGEPKRRRFLDPLDTLGNYQDMSQAEAIDLANASVERSVEAHLMSDVGYAVQLSGGVDSSLVAAIASRGREGRIASFSIDLGSYEHNERKWRDMVIARYPLTHHELLMDGRDYADSLPRAVKHLEGPLRHTGCPLLMRVCDEVRKHTKVVLTGEGADEFFGGYQRYEQWNRLAWMERLSRLLPEPLWPARWPFLGLKKLAGKDAAAEASNYFDTSLIAEAFPDLLPAPGARGEASRRFSSFLERMFAIDQSAYLDSLLMRQDKVSMAASVEARVPFTHMPLVRIINAIPPRLRAPGDTTKPILKAVAERHLPRDLVRRRKVGLVLPVADWLADPAALGRYVDDLGAPNGLLRAFGTSRGVGRIVERFRKGEAARSVSGPLFRLVNMELWLRSLAAAPAAVIPGPAFLITTNS